MKPVYFYCEDQDHMEWWMESITSKLIKFSSNVLNSALERLDYSQYQRRPPNSNESELKSRTSMDTFDGLSDIGSIASSLLSDDYQRTLAGVSLVAARSRASTTGQIPIRDKSPDSYDSAESTHSSPPPGVVVKSPVMMQYGLPLPSLTSLKVRRSNRWQELSRRRSSPFLQHQSSSSSLTSTSTAVASSSTQKITQSPLMIVTVADSEISPHSAREFMDKGFVSPIGEEFENDHDCLESGMITPTFGGYGELVMPPKKSRSFVNE